MNVTELARQLKTTKEELLEKLPGLGFDVGLRAIKIDNVLAERIKGAWAQQARRERIKQKMQTRHVAQDDALPAGEAPKQQLHMGDKITVNDLAQKLNTEVPHLIGYLMKNGIMASLNEQVDFETASIVAEDYGFAAVRGDGGSKDVRHGEQELRQLKKDIATDAQGEPRPPVVVVMGHVDHGKTTLLDAIRKTNVAAGESGGITQHIGAYQAEEKNRIITFLDTPGHEAFRAMRERGGQVADIAILIVAADDGLKPQTLESINVIQKEGLPFVVAINKIDKPGADIDRVKKELSEINLVPEDWGGKTICVPISAKKGEGIHELLDMVLLVADMEKLTSCPKRPACGVIIESHVSSGEGPVATVLVNVGTLKVGDEVVIGDTFGKAKALKDWRNEPVNEARPSMPVKILGLKAAPHVGEILRVQKIDRSDRKKAVKQYRLVAMESREEVKKDEADDEEKKEEENKNVLTLIVKADVLGSLEALIASIKKQERTDVPIYLLKQGLGNITESDIALAEDSGAVVYGFNVQLSAEAQRLAYDRKAEIKLSKVIYEILDDIGARVKTFIKTETIEVSQGNLLVLRVFKDTRSESIIGARVQRAKITSGAKFRLMREGEPVDEGTIAELQQNKQPVAEVKEGVECGARLSGARGFKEGDTLECFTEEERQVA